ncbi:MAG: aminopeptidase [Planctomycetes bacterium]|nr:aminopeptidase [Planctomycetota bacterium]
MKLRVFATLLILQCILTGCYYTHAYKGQLLQQISQVKIEDYLEHFEDLHPVARHRLELILSVRKFATEEIGLNAGDNYTKIFDTQGYAPSYVVFVAYPDKLEYYYRWFPIVGKLPYKGYFDVDMAISEAKRFAKKDFDVFIGQASAYSTLGYFDDPVFSSMLGYDEIYLVGLIIHELLHNTVYEKDFAEFNESLATFFEREGTLLYVEQTLGKDSGVYQHAQKIFADEDLFVDLVKELVQDLNVLYARDISLSQKLSERKVIFDKIKTKYKNMRDAGIFKTEENDWLLKQKLNNALILKLSTYKFNLDLYRKVAEIEGSLRDAIPVFNKASETADPFKFLANYAANYKME